MSRQKYWRKKTSKPRVDRVAQQAEEFRKENLDASAIEKKIETLGEKIKQQELYLENPTESLDDLYAELSEQSNNEGSNARREAITKYQRQIESAETGGNVLGAVFFISLLLGFVESISWIVTGLVFVYFGIQQLRIEKRQNWIKELQVEANEDILPLKNKVSLREREIELSLGNAKKELKEKKILRRAWRKVQKEIQEQERERRRKEKQEQVKAQADAYRGDIREQSETIKRRLKITHDCPYCGENLGTDYHADHIYPVSKGGLSTTQNMVNVCRSCNQEKAGFTLRQFCEKNSLNESEIAECLNSLGKEY